MKLFQQAMARWAVEKGRCALFANTGLGKFIGAELKESYWKQARDNLALVSKRGPTLLDLMTAA